MNATSDDAGQEPDADVTTELSRLDDERSELREEIQGLHAQLRDDGPMDAADRSSILTQVEELEGGLSGLDQRSEQLQNAQGNRPSHGAAWPSDTGQATRLLERLIKTQF